MVKLKLWQLLILESLFVLQASSSSRSSFLPDENYDSSNNIFSPRGSLLQMDYAQKVVDKSPLCIGACCADGVVLATRHKKVSAALTGRIQPKSIQRLNEGTLGLLIAGLSADGRSLSARAMDAVRAHHAEYGESITGRVLADQMGSYLHSSSVKWNRRPYPNTLLLGFIEDVEGVRKPGLIRVEGGGAVYTCRGCVVGAGSEEVRERLGKLLEEGSKSCDEVVKAMRALIRGEEGEQGQPMQLEVCMAKEGGGYEWEWVELEEHHDGDEGEHS